MGLEKEAKKISQIGDYRNIKVKDEEEKEEEKAQKK